MNLALLISQVALFLLWPRRLSRHFFFWSFVVWRAAYNAGLGWVLTKQSKRKWIVREVQKRGWLDGSKRPEVRAWIRKQLSVKMGCDYDFDVSRLPLSRCPRGGVVDHDAWRHLHRRHGAAGGGSGLCMRRFCGSTTHPSLLVISGAAEHVLTATGWLD